MVLKINFILLSFLLAVSCSEKNQPTVKAQDYIKNNFVIRPDENDNPVLLPFECDSFKYDVSEKYYINKDGEPTLNKKDTIDLIEYAVKSGHIKYAVLPNNKKDTLLWKLFELLPRIRGIINSAVYDSILLNHDEGFKEIENVFKEHIVKGAPLVVSEEQAVKAFMLSLTIADAVILGEIVDKRFVRDTAKCFQFGTEFIIKVDEVLHSYFKLEKNSKVLIRVASGFAGGCDPKNPKIRDMPAHGREFYTGDKGIFYLNHAQYYTAFIFRRTYPNNYNDKYCSRAFQMESWNELSDYRNDSLLNNIRLFYKAMFKN
jgi:hypothetical protein